MRRAKPNETPCDAVWPITGKPCRNAPCDGHDTCEAHAPEGDLRAPAPPEEQRCTATNRESGERCRRHHRPGGKVCAPHGGNAKQVRQAANVRAAEAKLTAKAAKLVGEPVDNPLVELGRVAGRARAWMELLEGRVEALLESEPDAQNDEDEGEGDGSTQRRADIRYAHRAGEQTRAEVQLYERAMAQLGTMLTAIARLNIDERLAKVTDAQAQAVMGAVEAAIEYLANQLSTCPQCGHRAGAEHEAEAFQVAARTLRAVK